MARVKPKSGFFWKFYIIYLLVIALALCGVYYYVRGIMIENESRTPESYILDLINNADKQDSELAKYMEENCFGGAAAKYGDPAARSSRFYDLAKNAELTVESSSASYDSAYPAYEVLADGKPFLTVILKEGEPYTRLGILTISDWTIESCLLRSAKSTADVLPLDMNRRLSYSFSYPKDFTLRIDGVALKEFGGAKEYDYPEFIYVAPYTAVPVGREVKVEGLTFEPEFKMYNNIGEETELIKTGKTSYKAEANFVPSEEAAAMAEALQPLEIAKLWSKFMTNDVGGKTHGLATVRNDCRLLEGTNLYDLATNWATSVDITFVSHHTIDSWTNGSVENCVKYSDEFFTCDVYLEKNLTLTTKAKRTDVFHERMYFVNIDGNWYLVDLYPLDEKPEEETEPEGV